MFPEPMDLNWENVTNLSVEIGTVAWRSKGETFLLFIQNHNQMFFIGQDESVWNVEGMNFPGRTKIHTTDTVIFGVSLLLSTF